MNKLLIIKISVALLATLSITVSCTNQDALFGNGLVPPSQGMSTLIDSSMTVRTSIISVDSIPTSLRSGVVFLGAVNNPIVGLTVSDVMTNYVPDEIKNHPNLFGKNPTLDSMFIFFNFDNVKGDTSYKLHISIHEVKDTIFKPSNIYYSNFAAAKYYNPIPISEFDLSGGVQSYKHLLPRSYFERLFFNVKDPATNPYYSDTMFTRMFKGFYIKVRQSVPASSGAMYRLNMVNTTMQLHYHNKEEKPDTSKLFFYFNQAARPNVNFYVVRNDFQMANPAQGGVDYRQINDSTIQVPTLYATGMAGLGARVIIDTTYLNKLQQAVIDSGYKKIAIQRASIRWYLNDPSPEKYRWIPSRLGLYYSFLGQVPVPDYDPAREAAQGSSFQSDLDGYINRSNGYYEQVITSTIQRLVNKSPNAKSRVELMPSIGDVYNYGYVSLGGSISTTSPPTMVIVYTMLR